MSVTDETLYWIFSTLPQVLAALVGLIVTGVVFYYPSLDRRAENIEGEEEVVAAVKKKLHKYVVILLICTSLCLVLDIMILTYATQIASIFSKASDCCLISWAFWLSLCLNFGPIIYLVVILSGILHPKFESDAVVAAQHALIAKQEKYIKRSLASNDQSGRRVKITDTQFLEIYREFEDVAVEWAKSEGMRPPLTILHIIRQLEVRGIIGNESVKYLEDARTIRNFIYHGTPVPILSGSIMKTLVDTIDILKSKIEENSQN